MPQVIGPGTCCLAAGMGSHGQRGHGNAGRWREPGLGHQEGRGQLRQGSGFYSGLHRDGGCGLGSTGPEGCQVCILSREREAAYQQWLRPYTGHPKKILANFRPFQLGCNQLFFFLIMAGKAQKWLAKARVGTEKNE